MRKLTGNAAVVYFSCTGHTEGIARKVAEAADAEMAAIIPEVPYTEADLDYNSDCRANAEQDGGTARPAMASPVPDVADVNVVYLGFPIWWGKAPRIVLTWLESQDLAGKTVVPFCTSGSSPISGSIAEVKTAAKGAQVEDGKRFPNGASQGEVDSWVASVN